MHIRDEGARKRCAPALTLNEGTVVTHIARETAGRQAALALYALALVAVVVAVDVLFFRGRIWERLMANVGIVLVFLAFYLRFLDRR